jgi:hypothetical protein
MNVSKEVKNKVRNLARRFTDNTPSLCRDHKPDGLPIDAPEDVNVSKNHASYKFEKLLKQESESQALNIVDKSLVRIRMREIFAKEYHKDSNKRACVKCYNDNESQSIRMELGEDTEFR